VENEGMKSAFTLILILSLYSLEVLAGPACNVELFKKQYVDLQNALRYEGQTLKLEKGKVKPSGADAVDNDNSPGKKAEMALYKNYRSALGKVKKIYEYMNANKASAEEKKILANSEVTSFFKAIDPASTSTNKLNVNIETLLNTLKDKVPGKDFSLDNNDVYLLKKLLIHSQDRICTLDNYVASKKGTPASRVQYLEQLKNAPLNKMIESLRTLPGSEDVKLSNEEAAVMSSVKEQIDNLHKTALTCKNQLNNLNLGETIQGCNYNHFLKSLTADENSYRPFEAILHFINANQNAANGRTNLEWLNNQLSKDSVVSCEVDQASKEIYVRNFPYKNDRVDASKFKCTKNDKELAGEACVQGLKYEFVNGRGFKISSIKDGVQKLSIKDSTNCVNISLAAPVVSAGPVAPVETEEQKCLKDEKKEWKEGKCVDKKIDPPAAEQLPTKCNREQCEKLQGIPLKQWHTEGAFCYSAPVTTVVSEAKTRAICNESGDLNQAAETEATCKDKKKNFDAVKKICIDPPAVVAETEESCKKKKMDFDKEKQACVALTEEQKCKKQNDEWLDGGDKEESVRTDRYSWKDKKCVDKQEKKSSPKEEEDNSKSEKEIVYPNKPVPGRFQPVNIPSRQVFILPGMP
jgi:hypothetical protein